MSKAQNVRWAGKVMRAKNFVVLTDKESVICMSGLKTVSANDVIMLASQAAELEAFDLKLQSLIKQHDRVVERLLNEKDSVHKTEAPKKKASKVKRPRSKSV